MKLTLMILLAFMLTHCQKSGDFSGNAAKRGDGSIESEKVDEKDDGNDKKNDDKKKKKNGSDDRKSSDLSTVECDIDLALASEWEGLTLPLYLDGDEGDLCEALKLTEKKSAVVFILEEDCDDCAQELRNVHLALQRDDYRADMGLIVIGYDEDEESMVEQQAPGSVYALDEDIVFAAASPEDVLEDHEEKRRPLVVALNADMDFEFVHTDTYLEVVDKTIELLKDVDEDAEGDPLEPKTKWDGDKHAGTGFIDVIPTH